VLAVHDLLERPTVRLTDRLERAVGRMAEVDDVANDLRLREAQHTAGEILVGDGGMTSADAEVGGGHHHLQRRLAQVLGRDFAVPGLGVVAGDQRHGRGGVGNLGRVHK
jgi:hypothetical protein